MKDDYKKILIDYGYDIKKQGFIYFQDLIEDVRKLLKDGMTDDEIRVLLPRYELEYYHFFYEVGKKKYTAALNEFCKSPLTEEESKMHGVDAYATILFFSKKFNELEDGFDNNDISQKKMVM